jgi:hypothetical protein
MIAELTSCLGLTTVSVIEVFSPFGTLLSSTLPNDLGQADISYEHFKRQLKTFLTGENGAYFDICP